MLGLGVWPIVIRNCEALSGCSENLRPQVVVIQSNTQVKSVPSLCSSSMSSGDESSTDVSTDLSEVSSSPLSYEPPLPSTYAMESVLYSNPSLNSVYLENSPACTPVALYGTFRNSSAPCHASSTFEGILPPLRQMHLSTCEEITPSKYYSIGDDIGYASNG